MYKTEHMCYNCYMNDDIMDKLRTAIRQFLDYQLDADSNAKDPDAYLQLVSAYAIEWGCDRLRSTMTDEQITELIDDLRRR